MNEETQVLGGDAAIAAAEAKAAEWEKSRGIPDESQATQSSEAPEAQPERTEEREPAEAPSRERDEWLAKAKEFGFEIDDGKVVNRERAELRVARKRIERDLNSKAQQIQRTYEEKIGELQEDVQAAGFFRRAIETRDYDSIAKAAGFRNFGEMSIAHVQRAADPAMEEVRTLRQQLEARDRAQAARAEQERVEREARSAEAQRTDYVRNLHAELSSSADPAIAGLAADPDDGGAFTSMVFAVQQEHYDGHSTVSIQQAAKIALDRIRSSYDRTSKILGHRTSSTVETAVTARRKPKTTISQHEISDAAGESSDFDHESWRKKWGAKMSSGQ